MKKILFSLAIVGLLSACGTTVPDVKVTTISSIPEIPTPQLPEPVVPVPYHWSVLNSQDIINLAAQLKAKPDPNFSIFTLTPSDYNNNTGVLIDMLRYSDEQREIIRTYMSYIDKLSKEGTTKK